MTPLRNIQSCQETFSQHVNNSANCCSKRNNPRLHCKPLKSLFVTHPIASTLFTARPVQQLSLPIGPKLLPTTGNSWSCAGTRIPRGLSLTRRGHFSEHPATRDNRHPMNVRKWIKRLGFWG